MSKEFRILKNKLRGKTLSLPELESAYENMSQEYREYVKKEHFMDYFGTPSSMSFLWHDYESWGADTHKDQASQFAAIRTDWNLNPIDLPMDYYCKPSPHRLPHPIAVQVTHISPLHCLKVGLNEYDFFSAIKEESSIPNTCSIAYNGINFDREMTRFSFYRNLFPAYAHESMNGNSVWDIIMVGAMCRALRPEGIVWPENNEGRPSIRLEDLAPANGIIQENAHNAVDDVKALIDWARLLKSSQEKLWSFMFDHKHKKKLKEFINFGKPYVHTAMTYGLEHNYTTAILPLFPLFNEPDSIIAINLRADYKWIHKKSPEVLREILYMKKAELEEKGLERPPIVKIKLAKCPAIAPVSVINSKEVEERIGLTLNDLKRRANEVKLDKKLKPLIEAIYDQESNFEKPTDPEQQLYGFDFFNKSDNLKINQLHSDGMQYALKKMTDWNDERIPTLLKRIIAKNWPKELSPEQLAEWKKHCIDNCSKAADDDSVTFDNYEELANEHIKDENLRKEYIEYVQSLKISLSR